MTYCSILLLLFSAKQGLASASCCGVGSAQGGAASGVAKGVVRLSFGGTVSGSNGKVSGANKVDDPQNTVLNIQATSMAIGYGITEKISLELGGALRWAQRTTAFEHPITSSIITKKQSNFGLGDATVATRYSLFRYSVIQPGELTIGIQASIPSGPIDHKQNGTRLPREMQSGTGIWALTGSGYFDWWWPWVRMGAIASINGTLNLQSSDSLDLGDKFTGSATLVGGPFGPVRISGGAAYAYAFPDRQIRIGERELTLNSSTGGTRLTALLGFVASVSEDFAISATAELPLWRNLNGIQTSTGYTISLGTVLNIGVFMAKKSGPINLEGLIDHTGHDHNNADNSDAIENEHDQDDAGHEGHVH